MRSFVVVAALLAVAACSTPEERVQKYLANGQAYLDAGDIVKAEIEAKNAAQIAPKNPQARYLLAQIAELQNDPGAMLANLIIAIDEDPGFIDARLKLGGLFFLGQLYDDAAEQVQALLQLAPDSADVHVLNAQVLFQQGDREASWTEIDRALALDPLHVSAILIKAASIAEDDSDRAVAMLDEATGRLGPDDALRLRSLKLDILAAADRLADLESEIQRLVADFPEERSYQFQLAELYASQGRSDDAEQVFRDIVTADPEDVDRQLDMVSFVARLRDIDAATRTLEAFVAERPDSQQLRVALAQVYETAARTDQAMAEYRRIADQDPLSKEGLFARNQIAYQRIRANDIDAARQSIDAILVDEPGNIRALQLRSMLNYAGGRYDEAVADLRIVLANEPEQDESLLLLARTYQKQNLVAQAADSYRRLLEFNPGHEDALRELTTLAVEQRAFGEAEDLLRRRLETGPEDIQVKSLLIEVLAAQGEFDEAEALSRELLDTEPGATVGAFQLGRILQGRQRYEESAEAYRRALEGAPESAIALEGLVFSLFQAGEVAAAKTVLEQRIAENPDEIAGRYLLANIAVDEGDANTARRLYEEVIERTPQFANAYLAIARTHDGDPEAQATVYRRGLESLPGNSQLGILLGSIHEQSAEYEAAIEVYERVLESNPDAMIIRNNLAATLLDRRDDSESHRRALDLVGIFAEARNPAFLDTLGWAHYRTGDSQRAVQYLERAAAMDNAARLPVIYYHLGIAYSAAGDPVSARQELKRAIGMGDFDWSDEARAALAGLN